MADAPLRGRFVWHELMTTDTKSAASFFSKIIGWKTQPFPQDPSYTMFLANDRPMAGLMPLPDEAKAMGTPPTWMSYIGTPDVDATARQAASLGGKIHKQPSDIPTIGRFAVLEDPQGAMFIAFTPLPPTQGASSGQMPQPPAAGPGLGDYSWHELLTTDWRAALTFYQALFGWQATDAMDMGEMGTYQMFGLEGKTFGGMYNKPKQMPGPPVWIPYIHVADSKQVAAAVKKLGGTITSGPMEVPGGTWIAQGLDLQGALFAVHSPKPADSAPAAAPPAKKPAPKAPAPKAPAKTAAPAKKKAAPAKKKAAKKSAAKKPAAKKKAAAKPVKKAATKKSGKKTGKAKAAKKAPKKVVKKAKRAAKKPAKKASGTRRR